MRCLGWSLCFVLQIGALLLGEERYEPFDTDPGWDGLNNRTTVPAPQVVRQDFGFSRTNHAGGVAIGELGGHLTPAAETAYYAKPIPPATLDDRLTASGTLKAIGGQFHVLLGFFNSQTTNEWRTPNSLFLRLYGRGDVFYAYVEYATARWRAGGDTPGGFATTTDPDSGRQQLRGFSRGESHSWSLAWDPDGNNDSGVLTVTIDDETSVCDMEADHRLDGAKFDRFGLLSIPKSYDDSGEVYLDDVSINGEIDRFDDDPRWEGVGNRRTYTTSQVRPRFDFGFSDTQFAGGERPGELGGVVFRGDCRDPRRLAYYGDRLEWLTLDQPLHAAGKVALRRGVSDSTVLLGFFHSEQSVVVSESQDSGFPMNFVGLAIEGPSREGFQVYPVFRLADGTAGYQRDADTPHILPDGQSADWSLEYAPQAANGSGRLTVTFAGQAVSVELDPCSEHMTTRFNRFGLVTTWIDGNAQCVYFDDLTYTWRQGQ